ncbi:MULTISPECIES: hypothetical protein [Hyphobacterium]|uniref:AI-2E family transporter n=1 Tax=Hyphobacterium vulgare TaxID=1736751 RepID=A0ABV7A117_9PROT
MNDQQKDYSREAILERMSHGRRSQERSRRPIALVLDGLALALLLLTVIGFVFSDVVQLSELFVIAPIFLFLAGRFFNRIPTVLGWVWLALAMIGVVIALAATFF